MDNSYKLFRKYFEFPKGEKCPEVPNNTALLQFVSALNSLKEFCDLLGSSEWQEYIDQHHVSLKDKDALLHEFSLLVVFKQELPESENNQNAKNLRDHFYLLTIAFKAIMLSCVANDEIECNGLTIFANVDKIKGPVPFSIPITIGPETREVRVRTIRRPFADSLLSQFSKTVVNSRSDGFPNVLDYTIGGASTRSASYIILVCKDQKVLAYKFISQSPMQEDLIWNVSGGLANPSFEKGLGTLLMHVTVQLARWYKKVEVFIDTLPEAYDFYRKIGFEGTFGGEMSFKTGVLPRGRLALSRRKSKSKSKSRSRSRSV